MGERLFCSFGRWFNFLGGLNAELKSGLKKGGSKQVVQITWGGFVVMALHFLAAVKDLEPSYNYQETTLCTLYPGNGS